MLYDNGRCRRCAACRDCDCDCDFHRQQTGCCGCSRECGWDPCEWNDCDTGCDCGCGGSCGWNENWRGRCGCRRGLLSSLLDLFY